ncbi:MAG: thioredoxin [Kofleriaceae bacterium]|jgi:thioredoxin 1
MASHDTLTFTDRAFATEVLDSSCPVLVDFWAAWCGPCRVLGPVIDHLATEYAGQVKIGKLNIDENQRIAATYEVHSIPTLLVFKGGRVVDRVVGAVPKAQIAALLEKHKGEQKHECG